MTSAKKIQWKIYCKTDIENLFQLLTSTEGRTKFWAEEAIEENGKIYFIFPNKQSYVAEIIEKLPPKKFSLIYFDSKVSFILSAGENGGTDITLINEDVPEVEYDEMKAGWISVLLALKAYADFGVDIRNHDSKRTWDNNYVDN